MHGVVSCSARQTDSGDGELPLGSFFSPPHTVVKQTTSAEGSPTSRLLLFYSHRRDPSPSIHKSSTSWTAWPVWTASTPEIFNTFYRHMVANSSGSVTNSLQVCFCVWVMTQMGLLMISTEEKHWNKPSLGDKNFWIVTLVAQFCTDPSNNPRCALICAFWCWYKPQWSSNTIHPSVQFRLNIKMDDTS